MAGLNDFPMAGVLRAEDFNRAKKFYTEVLGLVEDRSIGPDSGMFSVADGATVMIYERPGMPAPENTTLAFGIPNDAWDFVVADLLAKGVVFEEYDMPEMGIQTTGGIAEMDVGKAAWFKDTEGNILNITTM